MKTPCTRKCHDCGNVADHLDNIAPEVCCRNCGSQDTRLVKKQTVQLDAAKAEILSAERVNELDQKSCSLSSYAVHKLCQSHERLRAERDELQKKVDKLIRRLTDEEINELRDRHDLGNDDVRSIAEDARTL